MPLIFSTSPKLLRIAKTLYGAPSIIDNSDSALYISLLKETSEVPIALNQWINPIRVKIKSISDAAKQLKSIQRNWLCYSLNHHRRSQLIQDSLPPIKNNLLTFGNKIPTSPLGSWALINENEIIYSSACTQLVPYGKYNFIEDKTVPSRAYLKLWDFFTRFNIRPSPSASVLELGASPGGWTWVLSKYCKNINAIDKSPLDPKIKWGSNVHFEHMDLLKLDPLKELSNYHWLFCDAALSPIKLIEFLSPAFSRYQDLSFMCTLKLQDDIDLSFINMALNVEGSSICHLSNNKHELSWYRITKHSNQELFDSNT